MLKDLTNIEKSQGINAPGSQYLTQIDQIIESDEQFYVVHKAQDDHGQHQISEMHDLDKLEELDVQTIVYQLVSALKGLNLIDVVAKNLKPRNVIVKSDSDLNIQIMDVGFQCLYAQKKPLQIRDEDKKWMAPERKVTAKVDVWSVGTIAYWLLVKEEPSMPLSNASVQQDLAKVEALEGISGDCKDFIKKAYAFDVNQRADIKQLMAHPWISSFIANNIAKKE